MSSFDYTISHRSGNSIHLKVPDALSRRVYESQSTDDEADKFLQGFDIIESNPHELKDKQPPDAEGEKCNRVHGRPPRGLAPKTAAALLTDADHQIDREILIKEQRNDSDLKPILDYLLNGILPSEPQAMRKILLSQADYSIDNDILYHVELFNGRGKRQDRSFVQIAIPRSLIGKILESGHDRLFKGGHLGIQRTWFKIRMKYHWKTVTSDVANFVQSCQV